MIKTIYHNQIDLFNVQETLDDMKLGHIVSKDYGEIGLLEKFTADAGPTWLGCEIINEQCKEEVLSERMIHLSHSIVYPGYYRRK